MRKYTDVFAQIQPILKCLKTDLVYRNIIVLCKGFSLMSAFAGKQPLMNDRLILKADVQVEIMILI